LRRWIAEGGYSTILRGEYPRRGDAQAASVNAAVAEAARHYRDRFTHSQDPLVSLLRDAGGVVGTAVGWMTSRLGGSPNSGRESAVDDEM
jgi:hypothetical protein